MAAEIKSESNRLFILIWFGQLVSIIGSGLTAFGLGIWVYQRTGSVTRFALIFVFSLLPAILVSPVAGVVVDRLHRRRVLILSDLGAGLNTMVVALLLLSGRLELWHIYIVVAITSIANAFRLPAYTAATTLLVPKQHLARASGFMQMAQAAAQIISPPLAGVLIGLINISGVVLVDFTTFLFAVATLLMARIPEPEGLGAGRPRHGSFGKEAAYGWTYLKERPGLMGMLFFFAGINFTVGLVQVLFTPLVLDFASVPVLGMVLSAGGIGMLAGSSILSTWGGPKQRVKGILGFAALLALSVVLAGSRPSASVIAAGFFGIMFSAPLINGCAQVIWQIKVAPEVQGRVFALRSMIAWGTTPLAYLVAGPLAEKIFEPLMAANGPLAHSLGTLIGAGRGRGIGLLFIIVGTLALLVSIVAYLYPRFRLVEKEMPDAIAGSAIHAMAASE